MPPKKAANPKKVTSKKVNLKTSIVVKPSKTSEDSEEESEEVVSSISEDEDIEESEAEKSLDYGYGQEDDEIEESVDDEDPKKAKKAVIEMIQEHEETEKSERIILTGEKRIMSDQMTMYELSALISIRCSQIEGGSPVFVDIGALTDEREIAIRELQYYNKKIHKSGCPLKIHRYSHDNIYEEWFPHELRIPWEAGSFK